MIITKAVDLYLLDCKIRRLSPKSITSYKIGLKKFVEWSHLDDTDQLTKTLLIEYGLSLDSHKPQYQKNCVVTVNTWLKFLHKEEIVRKLQIPLPKVAFKVKQALTIADIQNLLKACNTKRDRLIIRLLLDTGVRANELCNIKIEDIDLDRGLILIKYGKTGERYVTIGHKVRKDLLLFINKDKGYLFTTNRNRQLNRSSYQAIFKRLQKRTGIVYLSSHTLRRTFAISLVRQGINVHLIAKLMGHKSIETLKSYLDFTLDDISNISVIDNL